MLSKEVFRELSTPPSRQISQLEKSKKGEEGQEIT